MTYSVDLRKRVVEFVAAGGSKAEASRRYEVSLWCVNDWCQRK
ncbi:MAG: IS630 family transposase, partial [Pleurocapsa sp. SU_5_0]|nr:IS630 family transposase [Pleurocapsa sp. SU_5_0]NJL52027.1 IS630 family transposase [Hydrococcus sp. SU_1_0]NJO97351.1 IS630 family transposase [Pleurocapsa sp. CRU_1_2]NJO99036.1 IS630 family transposase [Pleurocapsa sp. CRU_1_2]NJO99057.1 IS630 family transposase [Pleurocapsa sp. CRU_1_2]